MTNLTIGQEFFLFESSTGTQVLTDVTIGSLPDYKKLLPTCLPEDCKAIALIKVKSLKGGSNA